MIFALAKKEPALFVFLTEQDVKTLRTGHTLFVDQRQLKGAMFDRVILALNKTDGATMAMLKSAKNGMNLPPMGAAPEPNPGQYRCPGCDGIKTVADLFDGKCIVCWATEAKKARIANN